MGSVQVAAVQMACTSDATSNINNAERLVRKAAADGAKIILLQELFETPYFCIVEKPEYYDLALPIEDNPAVKRFSELARELSVVIPVSFYERANNSRYNSVACIDADGSILGMYRKAHIPDGPGYEEKFYFTPGDTGFKTWNTRYARIGIGICWDQWFPEAARAMVLQGAQLLFYPTAIGSEPDGSGTDSRRHWQRCMQGHAAANIVPVIASNRIGTEKEDGMEINFYGSSFMTDPKGDILCEASTDSEEILHATYDLAEIEYLRSDWAVFRDRRPEQYRVLLTMDGKTY